MNSTQLRTLVAVADSRSFAEAAEKLFITPSAVSHQVREIEEYLGQELFDRSTRPPRLNPHGQSVVTRGRDILRDLESLDQMARSPDEISGTLRLGCVSGVSIDLIPRALANIRQTHPAVQVQMEEGLSNQLAERVRRRDLDAAIITELADRDPELDSLLIVEEPLMVVTPKSYVYADWRDALSSHPFIRLNRNAGMGTVIDRVLRTEGLILHEAMELDSSEVIVGMVAHGLGAAVVPSGRLRNTPSDAVNIIPFGNPNVYRRVVLVEREENTGAILARLVYDELKLLTNGPAQQSS